MSKTEIEDELLKYFLNCSEKGLSCTTDILFDQLEDVDKDFFERVADELVRRGFLKGLKNDTYGEITQLGVLEIEKRRLIPDKKIRRNNEIRYKILETGLIIINRTATVLL